MAVAKRARRAPDILPSGSEQPEMPLAEGALSVALLGLARQAGSAGLVHVASGEKRGERLANILWRLASDVETIILPPWDCLPFDLTSPSPRAMGLRVAALTRLAEERSSARILLATPDALVQRVPPPRIWAGTTRTLSVGDAVDLDRLASELASIGYRPDERVDEAGDFAIRGAVIDLFPAGYYLPVRIDHRSGTITAIASFDAATQRKTDMFDSVRVQPVSEAIVPAGDDDRLPREPGLEHRLPDLYGNLSTVLDYASEARISLEPDVLARADAFIEIVREARASRTILGRPGSRAPAANRLYLNSQESGAQLDKRSVVRWQAPADLDARQIPSFALERRPGEAARAFASARRKAGKRVVVAGPSEDDLTGIWRQLTDGQAPERAEGWDAVLKSPPGTLVEMLAPLDEGFDANGVTVVAAADILGSRASAARPNGIDRLHASLGDDEGAFRIGDAVIHLEHGVGRLEGLEPIDTGSGPIDTVRLGYAGDATLRVPVDDVELMWRYGPMREGLALDRLGGDSWPKRRAKVEAEIGRAAAALALIAEERKASAAPKLVPPRRDYERFVARFPFSETPDQHGAAADILRDLASGRAMDRLVCGDVGFGKTELALRAAAAAALAGRQVAVAVAVPTTVLVRQHLETFTRRFADFGIDIGHLSRLVKPADAKAVKAGLARGEIRIVIGTHALAGRGVSFRDLGLLIIDEEHRFGAADKARLKRLGGSVHVLTMTATPIPRTLQAALVGLQDVSILATPPAERQPVRTIVMPLDDATMRQALMRERLRGGQSFVVCPRIEDIGPHVRPRPEAGSGTRDGRRARQAQAGGGRRRDGALRGR